MINQKNNIKETLTKDLVNLHCHTDESVGDGAISIETLIQAAKENNQKALALTNHGTLNGLFKFNKLCKENNIKAILGIEANINMSEHLQKKILEVTPKKEKSRTKERLKRCHLVLLAKNYVGYNNLLELHNINVEYMKNNEHKRNDNFVNGGIFYSNLTHHKELLKNIIALSGCIAGEIPQLLLHGYYNEAKQLAITYNTIFNKFYLELQYNGLKEQKELNKLLIELSNDTGIPLTVTGDVHYYKNHDDWKAIYNAKKKNRNPPKSKNSFMTSAPQQLAETTKEIADSIESYDIKTSLHIPKPEHPRAWLKSYCYSRLKALNIDDKEHRQRLEKELTVIKDEIADYHILLYEIITVIRDTVGEIGGRGSAVGSLVCYLLGFHTVDPLEYNLLFERFLNPDRIEKALNKDNINTALLPDIDINIADDKKDAAYKELEKHYKYITKVMTYSRLKRDAEDGTESQKLSEALEKFPGASVENLVYNVSKHGGGVIISTEPFKNFLPVTLSNENEIITDCNLDEVEARGGIKYDLLSESSTKINKGVKVDKKEYDELARFIKAHPVGISQFTGFSAQQYLKYHEVNNFNDLVLAIALVRPNSNKKWVFQEDMMIEATKYGLTLSEADYLRKPRGDKKQKTETINKLTNKLIKNGCNKELAEKFKEYHKTYSFNKSHAVQYAIESIRNAKIKKENTAVFFEKKLNHIAGGDKIKIAELFNDAIKLGVNILCPSRNYYKHYAKAIDNKTLQVGALFVDNIGKKRSIITKSGFCAPYKEYLRIPSEIKKLYLIGAYDPEHLPNDNIIVGYKKEKSNILIATISTAGFKVSKLDIKKIDEYFKDDYILSAQ